MNERLPRGKVPRVEEELYASWTPLHWTASQAKEDAMRLLEGHGADGNVVDG